MSRRESCRPHPVTGLEEQTAGLVYCPAALEQTLLHHRRGLGPRMKIVTDDGPNRTRPWFISGSCRVAGHMDIQKPSCAGWRGRLSAYEVPATKL